MPPTAVPHCDRASCPGLDQRRAREADAYVGKHAEGTRNPIRYEDSPFDLGACRCGCGAETKSLFLPGHDQRAIHARIAQVGSVAAFLDWFDDTWSGE